MADTLRVSPRLEIPLSEFRWTFTRASGPGGQHVNTSDTRVVVAFDVERSPSLPPYLRDRILERLYSSLTAGVLTVESQRYRSQDRNRSDALSKVQRILADATAPPPPARRATKPSRAAKQRRVDDKKRRGEIKKGRGQLRGE